MIKEVKDLVTKFMGFNGKKLYWYESSGIYIVVTISVNTKLLRCLRIFKIGDTWDCSVDREVFTDQKSLTDAEPAIGKAAQWENNEDKGGYRH